jgi:Tfp pilus assembly protein PilW
LEKSQRSNVAAEHGTTLVEVLIATVVLLTGVFAMAQMFLLSTKNNITSRSDTLATVLAEQKLEQLRSLAYGFDMAGLPVSDINTDTSVSPPAADGGTGLQPSPAAALQENTVGFVDYVDRNGAIVGNGAAAPGSAWYTRRWSVEPLPTNPNNTLILQVLVTPVRDRGAADQGNVARLQGEARVMTIKTRKAQ